MKRVCEPVMVKTEMSDCGSREVSQIIDYQY